MFFEEEYSGMEDMDGNRTELVVRSNVRCVDAKFLEREARQQVVVQHGQCRTLRASEDQAEQTDHAASSISV